MPVWAILSLVLFFFVFALINFYIHNQQIEKINPSETYQVAWIKGFGDRVFVLLPGMMKRSDEQFEPLFGTLRKYGSIDARAYGGHGFDLDQIARSVAKTVDEHIKNGRQVTLIGASIGGMVANRTVSYVINANPTNLEIIMIDTPFGVKTMKNFPNWLVFLTKIFPSAPLPNAIGNRIINKSNVDVSVINTNYDKVSYVTKLDVNQLKYLSSRKFSTWWRQLVVMVNAKPNISKRYLTIYISCEGYNNTIVAQPFAGRCWKSYVPGLVIYHLPTISHCSFDSQQKQWEALLDDLLIVQ